MDNVRAITAIANAEFESLVARTLFENGWDVEKRVLDARDISINSEIMLVLSLDLEGLTQELLNSFATSAARLIIFGPNPKNFSLKAVPIFEASSDPLFILSVIRGNQRAPLLQARKKISEKRAELYYIFSARPGVGASFLAANIAMEISARQKRTLLVDADLHFPSAYEYLGVRDISQPQSISPFLSAVELKPSPQDSYLSHLEKWQSEFEILIMDGGALYNTKTLSGDQRCEAALNLWAIDRATKHIAVTTPRDIDQSAHRALLADLLAVKAQMKVSTLLNMVEKSGNKATSDDACELPLDLRNVAKCLREKLLLSEGAPRSPLAKALSQFVREGLS